MVLQYATFVGAWKNAGGFDPLHAGIIASLYCTMGKFFIQIDPTRQGLDPV
jgi:hypothetical protein